jgi:hypothetical protein
MLSSTLYREDFYLFDEFTALHYMAASAPNFADESACLTANNIYNEVVTFHRTQNVLKMLSCLQGDVFHN